MKSNISALKAVHMVNGCRLKKVYSPVQMYTMAVQEGEAPSEYRQDMAQVCETTAVTIPTHTDSSGNGKTPAVRALWHKLCSLPLSLDALATYRHWTDKSQIFDTVEGEVRYVRFEISLT